MQGMRIGDVDVKDLPQDDTTLRSVDWSIQFDCRKLKCMDNIQWVVLKSLF